MLTIYNNKDKEIKVVDNVQEANEYIDNLGHEMYSVSTPDSKGNEQYLFPCVISFRDEKNTNNKL